MKELNNKHYIILGLAAALLFCVAAMSRNYYLYEIFCQKNYDFGIFVEAIRENAKGEINPWLNTRQIYQFSDHWTVIMSLISPLAKIFPVHHVALWGEMFALLGVGFALIYLVRKERVSAAWAALLMGFFYLNRDTFEAVYFPIHESTMAAFPLMLLGLLILSWDTESSNSLGLKISLLATALFLCLFSEQFSFAVLGLSIGLFFFTRDKTFALGLFILGLALSWWMSFGRAEVFTPVFPYYQQRILISFESFLNKYVLNFVDAKSFILHFVGMAPLLYVLWKNRATVRTRIRPIMLVLGLFGPLILGRIIAANFNLQYIVVIVIFWVVLFFVALPRPNIPQKTVIIGLLFFLIWSNNKFRKPFQTIVSHEALECARGKVTSDMMADRQERIKKALALLSDQTQGKPFRILANGNFLPNLLVRFPQAEVFQLGSYRILSTDIFEWILIETEPFGESHYITPANAIRVQELLKAKSLEIVYEHAGLMLVKGPIQRSWFEDLYYDHPQPYISDPRALPPQRANGF